MHGDQPTAFLKPCHGRPCVFLILSLLACIFVSSFAHLSLDLSKSSTNTNLVPRPAYSFNLDRGYNSVCVERFRSPHVLTCY